MRLALLGYPLSHSLSPAMHNAALAYVGLRDWRYEALPVGPERLNEVVAALRGGEYAGANVTVPHKESIIPLLDGLTPVAQPIGAVNTIVKREGLIGHNTDAAGLLADLHAHGVKLQDRTVMLIGAGGAARAAVAAVASLTAGVGARVRVMARRREQAEALQSLAPLEIFEWTELGFLQACDDVALILNSTPIGMSPNTEASPWPATVPFPPDAFVYDMIYNPVETRLIQQAREHGLRAATGLGMLVEQGALAFELWTDKPAPREVMREAAEDKLCAHPPTRSPASQARVGK